MLSPPLVLIITANHILFQLQQLGLPSGFRSHVIWWEKYLTINFSQYDPRQTAKHPRGTNCYEKRNI